MNGKEFEDFVHPEKHPYRTTDELLPFVHILHEVKNDFFRIVEELDHGLGLTNGFEDFYKNTTLAYSDRRFYYEIVFNIFDAAASTSPSFKLALNGQHISWTDNHEYRSQRSERDRLDGEIKNIEYQLDVQKKNLLAYGKPDGLWSGLFVIVYACAVGVIWPVILLPYPLKTYDDLLTKWVVLGWFFSALLALFYYLAWSTYRLTRK